MSNHLQEKVVRFNKKKTLNGSMDDLWYPEIGESQKKTKVYKELMKLNRNSTEFINNKQEFNAYQNVLQRLINQSENIYYSTQFENNKGDGRKTWRTMDNLLHRKSSKSIPDAIIVEDKLSTDKSKIADAFNK